MQMNLQKILHDMLILTKTRVLQDYNSIPKVALKDRGGEILSREKTQNKRSDCSFYLVGEIAKSAVMGSGLAEESKLRKHNVKLLTGRTEGELYEWTSQNEQDENYLYLV